MKVLGLALSAVFMLATPSIAVEYQGKNIDGKKLPAKAYYSVTGGVYNVEVSFRKNRATIYFEGGAQTTIRLRHKVITDPNDIEGFGKLGQFPVNKIFSVGWNYDDNLGGSNQVLPGLHPLEGFWRISLLQEGKTK